MLPLALGSLVMANFLGNSSAIVEDGFALFNSIKSKQYGEISDITQGLTGGNEDSALGSLSELLVDCGTALIPPYMQFGLNFFRGLGEIFHGDTFDAMVNFAGCFGGVGGVATVSRRIVRESKKLHDVSKLGNGVEAMSHIGSRAGLYWGYISKKYSPLINSFTNSSARQSRFLSSSC